MSTTGKSTHYFIFISFVYLFFCSSSFLIHCFRATCDSLSSKVIAEMIKKDNTVATQIVSWKDSSCIKPAFRFSSFIFFYFLFFCLFCCSLLFSPLLRHYQYMWRRRSSCVSFVKLARHGKYDKEVIEICSACVKSKERFVQLGVG